MLFGTLIAALGGQKMVILGYGAIAERLVAMLKPLGLVMAGWRRKARGGEIHPDPLGRRTAEGPGGRGPCHEHPAGQCGHTGLLCGGTFCPNKTGAVFYNMGRGTTVDQAALEHALRDGRLSAAWLDVTEPEPLPEGPSASGNGKLSYRPAYSRRASE